MAMGSKYSSVALAGFANATSYDSNRPSYPEAAVDYLLKNLGLQGKQHASILDLAAGTGKFTEILAGRPEKFVIIAVEPHPDMRDQLAKKNLTGVTVKAGSSVEIPSEDAVFDAVIVAQAFHWFATLESLTEINRVIKQGGALGMIWNIEDYNQPQAWTATTAWEAEIKKLTWSIPDDGIARFRNEKWRNIFEERSAVSPLFSLPIAEEKFPFSRWLTPNQLWARYHTLSQVALLPEKAKEEAKAEVMEILSTSPDAVMNASGEVELHGSTTIAWTSKA